MANRSRKTLRGTEGLSRALTAMGEEMGKKIAWSATRKGAKIIERMIADNYVFDNPETQLDVKDYLATQRATKTAKRNKLVAYRVGVMGGAKSPTPEQRKNLETPFYWRMIEFGTKNVPARPFVRPAAERAVSPVYITVAEEVWKGIERVLRKEAKEAAKDAD